MENKVGEGEKGLRRRAPPEGLRSVFGLIVVGMGE